MTGRRRIDLGVAAVCIALGALFAAEAWRIDPRSYEAVGPRAVPLALALVLVAGGAAIGLGAWLGRGAPGEGAVEPGGEFGFAGSDVARVVQVVGAGAAYALAFWALGYMVATMIGMALALWVFGVRAPLALVLLPVAAGILYQAVFMGLMGLLDPPGALIDLRWLSAPVTPG